MDETGMWCSYKSEPARMENVTREKSGMAACPYASEGGF
jgi:hypothetical protein